MIRKLQMPIIQQPPIILIIWITIYYQLKHDLVETEAQCKGFEFANLESNLDDNEE